MAIHRAKPLDAPDRIRSQTLFVVIPNLHDKISWGEPAKICQCKYDRQCPQCGTSQSDGFDIGFDENWLVFGARCEVCEWSF